ncbi:MAG: flagellar hook-length control protein FliK [Aestuariivirga sp.]
MTQQDEQSTLENDAAPIVVNAHTSLLPPSQLMGRGKLVDALQNFKDKPRTDSTKPNVFSNQSVNVSAVVDSKPELSSDGDVAVGKLTTVLTSENFPPPESDAPEKSIATKTPNSSVQAPKIAADETHSQPPTPFSDASVSPAQGKAVASAGTDKVTAEPKKELSLAKVEPVDASNSHVAQVSHPGMSETKLLSPAAQIVENIRNAVPPAAIAPRSATAIPMPVKTLEVQLQPEGLGPITVSLKTEQGKLKVEISTKLESTRHELERNSAELVSGLQRVDPSFKAADVNFSDQPQDSSADTMGQASGNGGDRRGTPENMSGFGSNEGRDANQPSANSRLTSYGKTKPEQNRVAGELPSRLDRVDGIYL